MTPAEIKAHDNKIPAEFLFAVNEHDAGPLVGDSRAPQVFDASIRIMKVVEKGSDRNLGTLLNWGNHPEILNGGVEAPDGGDFKMEPVEFPAIVTQMPGKFKFFGGMANDMIGYIVPKSQWDENAPFTYGGDKAPYGEVNSLGPETAPTLHSATMDLLKDLN